MPEWFESGEKWAPTKWGPDDELGTLNLLTPDKTLSATKLVKKGKVYRLSYLLYQGMPEQRMRPYVYMPIHRIYDPPEPGRHGPSGEKNKYSYAYGRLEMADHTGTHMDTLNHISYDNKLYNGIDSHEVYTTRGTTKLGVERSLPPIVTRGLLVDVPRMKKKKLLDKGYPITVDDTKEFLEQNGLTIQESDAILFYTGLSTLWMEPEKWLEYGFGHTAGVSYSLAKWLAEKNPAVVGSDGMPLEVNPSDYDPEVREPVHQYLLTKCGIRILDGAKLDELAKDQIYEFLFVSAPLHIKSATASPISPLAIV